MSEQDTTIGHSVLPKTINLLLAIYLHFCHPVFLNPNTLHSPSLSLLALSSSFFLLIQTLACATIDILFYLFLKKIMCKHVIN